MANFKITINNKSNSDRAFLLFQDMPIPSNLNQKNVFANIYQRSPTINGKGAAHTDFTMKQQYYAIYGTSQTTADGAIRVDTGDSVPAKLGPNGTLAVVTTVDHNGTDPTWDQSQMANTAQAKGGFDLRADNTFKFPNPNEIYIGCGAQDPKTGEVIPIQTWLAQPGVTSQIFPRVIYYIAFGNFEPGVVVDRNTIGQVLKVDFSGAAIPNATFTLTNNGTYVPDDKVESNGVHWSFGNIDGV
ncbi:hypothetical protein CPAR01_13967 [Colletotrichum paranaense]|uniref:Uncharacterized protein n=1 Tax=Colletotrichum paranaense TaxID=1914294 RepID=A0ABQ9S3A0_9PEZI|nr:uncharacterized protein CPAR01_13967 [Colletotrichum paranaense]KAK1523114.1 hypothetical protein CPAR01_13967 [Colletotrichum paranaense]